MFSSIIFLGLSLGAYATQQFKNTGTKAGWDGFNVEHLGTCDEVTNVYSEGPTALKMTQTYDNYGGRYHSEAFVNNGYHRGETKFYGFSFRLSETWEFDDQGYNLAQFIGDYGDYQCDDWIPSSMIWIRKNQLYSRTKGGAVCSPELHQYGPLATVTAGVWHTVIIQADWESGSTGYYKLWFDGVKVLEQYNTVTTFADDRAMSFRVGLYANSWYDDGKMVGSQSFRQVWYDEVAVGTTFADVDSTKWKRQAVEWEA